MKGRLEYKDFIGSVHFSADDEVFFGKIEEINDLVTFEGKTVAELKKAFRAAVDDYLDICQKEKKEPLRSFKGFSRDSGTAPAGFAAGHFARDFTESTGRKGP